MKLNAEVPRTAALLIGVLIAIAVGCAREPAAQPKFQSDMRDAYRAARELYGYVWSPDLFYQASSEKRISGLLDALNDGFHRAELDAPIEAFEPGFRVTLAAQKSLLSDAANRFKEGKKEYVNWQLRGMAANCISCHSRYQAPMNFIGDLPPSDEKSPESRLAQGEFLFATRQFDKASTLFSETVKSLSAVPNSWPYQFQALKMWLVIEVRAKNRPQESAKQLETIVATASAPAVYRSTLTHWIADLKKGVATDESTTDPLLRAQNLLRSVEQHPTLEDEEIHLVSTLKATSILHEYLLGSHPADARRKATFLLGFAYHHLPVPIFSSFGQQYLEVAIRDFPHTEEAMRAFRLYEDTVLGDLGVSGQGALAPDQLKALIDLRKLAYPEPAPAVLMRNFSDSR